MAMDKKEKKIRDKAAVTLAKAERLLDNGRYKKSAERFQKAGEAYFELGEWKIAEQSFLYASKNRYRLEHFHAAASLQRLAANCCLLVQDYAKARDYYDVAMKSILKSDAKNLDDAATTNMGFAFLCHFIMGQQDEALEFVKRHKAEIDPDVFSDHLLVKLVRNLSNAIINENEKYLEDILKEYPKYQFRAAEAELIRAAVLLAMCSVYIDLSLGLESADFERDEFLDIECQLDFSRLQEIEDNSVLPHKFESLKITDIGIAIGDNLSTKDRPPLPIKLSTSDFGTEGIPFRFRTNFPGKGYIGPIVVTVEVDNKFHFFIKSEAQDINIISKKAVLGVELTPQKTPVINQTFPLQVKITNDSEGDALEIVIEFEFPEDLRMMRGTLKKNIYARSFNEDFTWQIHVKAFEVGELPIKTIVSFKDGDGKERGPFTAEIPLNINL